MPNITNTEGGAERWDCPHLPVKLLVELHFSFLMKCIWLTLSVT